LLNSGTEAWNTRFDFCWSRPLKTPCRHSGNWSSSARWICSSFSLTVEKSTSH
jgi:hypothetical protein